MVYETFRRAKAFGRNPSDYAFLGDSATPLLRWYYDRGAWLFGEHVDKRVAIAARNGRAEFAASRCEWEFEQLMSGDASGAFADPTQSSSRYVRRGDGRDNSADDDDQVFEGDFMSSDQVL